MLRILWKAPWEREQELKLVLCTVNILGSQFDEDEIENIPQADQTDLELFKITVITQLFYRDNKYEALSGILNRLLSLIHSK